MSEFSSPPADYAPAEAKSGRGMSKLKPSGGADAAAQQALGIGGAVVDRQFDLQPTIVIRPGFKLNVLVNKDILEPY